MDLERLKCLHPPSSLLSLIMLQIIFKIILEIIWKYLDKYFFNLCYYENTKKRILKHRNHQGGINCGAIDEPRKSSKAIDFKS